MAIRAATCTIHAAAGALHLQNLDPPDLNPVARPRAYRRGAAVLLAVWL
jgi:hypothetical protein